MLVQDDIVMTICRVFTNVILIDAAPGLVVSYWSSASLAGSVMEDASSMS